MDKWLRKWLDKGVDPKPFVIEQVGPEGDLGAVEVFYIAYFKYLGFDLLNLSEGGEGVVGYRHTEEAKARISRAKKGKPNLHAKPLSEESKDRISLTKTGLTPVARREMAEMYQNRFSSNQIAEKFGVSQCCVLGQLRRAGVVMREGKDTRRKLSPSQELEVVARYKAGLSSADAGAPFGLYDSRCLLKRHSVPLRKPWEQALLSRRNLAAKE